MKWIPVRRNSVATLLYVPAGLILMAAGGLIASFGSLTVTGVVILGLLALSLAFRPPLAVLSLMIASLVIVGLLQLYLPQLQLFRWAIALSVWLIGGVALLRYLFEKQNELRYFPSIGFWLLALIGVAAASSIVNLVAIDTALFGFKGYFQIFGLFFAFALLVWPDRLIDSIPRLLVAIGLIQLPFVLHQYFVIVPTRIGLGGGIVAEDVVAGTLGASATGGGSNAVLSLVLITAISLTAAQYKRKLLGPVPTAMIVAICVTPLFLNANRIALLYLALAYLILFRDEVVRRPMRVILTGVVLAGLLGALLWANVTFSSRSADFYGWKDLIVTTVERNADPSVGYGEYQLNRLTSVTHWIQQHGSPGSVPNIAFGHGPGQSREAAGSSIDVSTLAADRYPGVGIGLTGISSILWELGLLGLFVVGGMFLSAYRTTEYLVQKFSDRPYRQAVVEGLQVVIVIFGISLLHKNTITFHLPYQALLFTVFGLLAYWDRCERTEQARTETI